MLAQQAARDMVSGPLMDSAAAGMQAAGPMLVQSAPPVAAAAGNSAESILPTPEVVATVPWGPVESESTAYPTTDPSAVSSAPASTTMPPQMPSLLPPVH
jgi:hypothetical protein